MLVLVLPALAVLVVPAFDVEVLLVLLEVFFKASITASITNVPRMLFPPAVPAVSGEGGKLMGELSADSAAPNPG